MLVLFLLEPCDQAQISKLMLIKFVLKVEYSPYFYFCYCYVSRWGEYKDSLLSCEWINGPVCEFVNFSAGSNGILFKEIFISSLLVPQLGELFL